MTKVIKQAAPNGWPAIVTPSICPVKGEVGLAPLVSLSSGVWRIMTVAARKEPPQRPATWPPPPPPGVAPKMRIIREGQWDAALLEALALTG